MLHTILCCFFVLLFLLRVVCLSYSSSSSSSSSSRQIENERRRLKKNTLFFLSLSLSRALSLSLAPKSARKSGHGRDNPTNTSLLLRVTVNAGEKDPFECATWQCLLKRCNSEMSDHVQFGEVQSKASRVGPKGSLFM